jgi:hypothetical protein
MDRYGFFDFDLMKNKDFSFVIGLGGSNEFERDAQMRPKYLDPIEHFPDKMDQLLDALNRVKIICY